jgi:Zn-dependent metalloprotease
MKELKYKNRIGIILDVIFNMKRFRSTLYKMLNDKEVLMQDSFDEKIRMLEFEQMKKGMVSSRNNRPVLEVPIMGAERSLHPSEYGTVNIEKRKVKRKDISFTSSQLSATQMQDEAAYLLGEMIVKDGFLNTEIQGNTVRFSINTFE